VKLLFDTENARRLAACGIVWPDGGGWLMTAFAGLALGKDPATLNARDLPEIEAALMRVRPFVRHIDSHPDNDLANGDICVTIAPSEGMAKARDAATQAGRGVQIEYVLPEEGGLIWIDLLAVPADASNIDAAHRFIDYLLEPAVIAEVTNTARIANPNRTADDLIDRTIRADRAVYPPDDELAKLHPVATEVETSRSSARPCGPGSALAVRADSQALGEIFAFRRKRFVGS
jgi:putrescine transport system substrate-binding protein